MILRVRIPPGASQLIMNAKATSQPIEWTGDLDDDCTAIWCGLMLRAEEMDRNSWWWAVSMDEGRGDEIRSSNYEDRECRTGAIARQRAEECARDFLNAAPQTNQGEQGVAPNP